MQYTRGYFMLYLFLKIYISAYQFDKALDLLSECYIKDPQNTDYLLKIAYCHSQSGRYPDAKLFYEETIKIDSLNLTAINTKEELDKAEEHFKIAIEKGVSPQMGEFHAGLAALLEEKNQLREAIRYYEKAIEYGADAETIFHLARNCDLYYKDKNIALRHYQKYLKTKDNKYREYTARRLKQLKEIIHFQND